MTAITVRERLTRRLRASLMMSDDDSDDSQIPPGAIPVEFCLGPFTAEEIMGCIEGSSSSSRGV